MNYAGKFDATFASEGPATHSHAHVNVDSSQTHAPADAIIVPDAQLLFHADYTRSGTDLILSKDSHEFVLHDYFKGGHRAPLASRDGAHLTADIVKALVGEVDVAQAANSPAASQVIGHVTKMQGSATVIRNGVSIILNMGDNVEKGDVVQSGSSSTVGITFIDGTVFGLSSNARMVLNEMVYDPNGSSNSSLMSLVAGTITFVAGETAKHGDMKIDTPVATMGIRGTAVLVEIDFSIPGQNGQPNASFQVLVEPDGTTGSYILFDKTTLQPIAIVNQAGQQLNINNGIISQTTTPLSPDIQKLITDVFQQKFTDNSNTKTNSPYNDSITPEQGPVIKLASGPTATPTYLVTGGTTGSSTPPPNQQLDGPHHVSGTLTLQSVGLSGPQAQFATTEIAGITGEKFVPDHVGGFLVFGDFNTGDQPTVTADFSKVVYTNGTGGFTVGAGAASAPGLSALQFADISATAITLSLVPDLGNANNGRYTWLYALPDNAFDFLAAGETLTFTYHVTVNSNFALGPESTGLDITIVVTGTNDKPVISTGPQTIAFAAGTTTKGGDLTTQDPTSGTLAFADVDLTDKHTVSTKLTSAVMSNGGTVPSLPEGLFETALTASIATDSTGTGNGVVNWQLADLPVYLADFIPKGQTVTLTYTVTVTDSNNEVGTQTVTVTINGTEPAAEVWIHTTTDGHDNLWTTGQNWETGNAPSVTDDAIIITNQLHPDTPAYPAVIAKDPTSTDPNAKNGVAFAHSVTMNDFTELLGDPDHTRPELDVASGASLTIGADLSLSADSKLVNDGTITVGGKIELKESLDENGNLVLNQSTIENSRTLTLDQGGDIQGTLSDFDGKARVANSGLIDLTGGTLNVQAHVVNYQGESPGQITVENGATLVLGTDPNSGVSGAITGGTVTIQGELDLQGSNFLNNGMLVNTGQIKVAGTGNSLDNETVKNLGGSISITGTLTLDDGTTISDGNLINSGTLQVESAAGTTLDGVNADNAGGTIAVDRGESPDTVTLLLDDGTTITNGAITIGSVGILEVSSEDGATLDGVGVGNSGTIQIDDGSTLLLDDDTFISGGNLVNDGTLQIEGADGATLDGVVVDNTYGTIAVDGSWSPKTVTLILDDGTVITHGNMTIGKVGILEISSVSGATLDGVVVDNSGLIQVDGGSTLLLDDGTTISGGGLVISGTLQVESATLDDVAVSNSGVVQVDEDSKLTLLSTTIASGKVTNNGEIDFTGSAVLKQGKLTNNGEIKVSGAGNALDGETVANNLILISIAGVLILESGTSIEGGTLINGGTLYIEASGATLDGVNVNNAGGMIEVDLAGGPPTLPPATLTLEDGTKVASGVLTIGNVGTLEISSASGATLSGVTVNVDHSGVIEIDSGSKLVLSETTINGGTINDGTAASGATIDVTHDSKIENATLNHGTVTVEAKLTLDGATVSGTTIIDNGSIEFDNAVKLTNGAMIEGPSGDLSGAVTNLGTLEVTGTATLLDVSLVNTGQTEIDGNQTLFLEHSIITGGTLSVSGTLDATGESSVSGANITIDSTGVLESTDGTLSIDPDQSLTIVNHGLLQADGGNVTITGDAVINTGTVQAIDDSTLSLSTLAVTNTGGTVSVEYGSTIDLSDANVSGGSVNIYGMLDSIGISAISASTLNNGVIEVVSGTLTLLGSLAGAGMLKIDANAVLDLNLDSSQDVTFSGGGAELILDGTAFNGQLSHSFTGQIHNFGVTDQIDLREIAYGTPTTGAYTYNATTGVLTVTDGNGDHIDLNIGTGYAQAHFAGSDDGHGGTLITLNANDDAPVFAQDSISASLFEQPNVSYSSSHDSVGGTIRFTDVDLTDRPTAGIIGQSVVDSHGNEMSSTLTPAELNALESALKLTAHSDNADNGAVDWSYSIADSSLDFLRADQTVTVTSTVKLDDHEGGADTATLSVTIHGSEDAPSIVSESNPPTQTAILSVSPTVLAAGAADNALGLHEETFDSVSVGLTSNNGQGHGDFTSTALDATFTASGNAGVVQGSSSVTAAPYIGPLPGHVDTSHYLSIGGGGSETITFNHDQNAFGLYWGSVDPSNSISFYEDGKLVATYSGADVEPLLASGGQTSFSSNGYVEFKDLAPFDKVVLASSSNAFEIDNISAGYIQDHHIQLADPVSGTLTVTDADVGDTLTAQVTAPAVVTYNGSTQLPESLDVSSLVDSQAISFDSVTSNGGPETLHWTYNPTNPNFDFLEPGDSLTLTFNAQVTDGHVTAGSQPLTVNIVGTGAPTVNGTSGDDVFVNVGGGVTILGHGGNDTFQFKPGFGSATIGDFNVNNDVINVDKSLFANINAILANAHTASNGLDTVITDTAHDQITLKGVKADHLTAQDFHLV